MQEKDSKIVSKIDLPFGYIALSADKILHTHIELDLELSIEQTLIIHEKAFDLTEGKAYPILYTTSKYLLPDKKTREFMVTKKRIAITKADAFVLESLPQRILGSFYLKINKPSVPTQFFENKKEALEWLKKFK